MVESSYLRDALMERRGFQQRARSTTPKRIGAGQRSLLQKDEWLQSSDDDSKMRSRISAARNPRTRRASDASSIRPVSQAAATTKSLGAREAESRLDRIEKENWDLKHRLTLFEERTKRLNNKIEEQEKEIEDLRAVEQRCEHLEEDLKLTQDQLESAQEENFELHSDNVDMTQINEELVQQLEQRVRELEDMEKDAASRQAAIEEAAGIIQMLEQQLAQVDHLQIISHPDSPPRTDSDYYSGERDPTRLAPTLAKPPTTANSVPDSDYFSADTSPVITPKSVKQVDTSALTKPPRLNAASMSSAAFNREVGLRSLTSKDSLFMEYIENPKLPQPTSVSRLARLRSLRKRATSQSKGETAGVTPEATKPKRSARAWLTARPLRNLYLGSDSSAKSTPTSKERPRNTLEPKTVPYSSSGADDSSVAVKASSTPSIAQVHIPASTPEKITPNVNSIKHVRSNSTNSRHPGVFRHNSTPSTGGNSASSPRSQRARHIPIADVIIPSTEAPRQHLTASSRSTRSASPEPMSRQQHRLNPVIYTTPPTQTAPAFPMMKPTTQTHSTPSGVSSPNYAAWPRRYPAWPPSAGLVNRGLMFHGEGLDEMFGNEED
jgi:hypothetical protein